MARRKKTGGLFSALGRMLFGDPQERKRKKRTAAEHKRRLEAQTLRLEERRQRLEGQRRIDAEDQLERLKHRLELARARVEVEAAERARRIEANKRRAEGARARGEYRAEHAGEVRPPADQRQELARRFAREHGGTAEQWEKILAKTGVTASSGRNINPVPVMLAPVIAGGIGGVSGSLSTRYLTATQHLHHLGERRNPAATCHKCEVCRMNPSAAEASQSFHGSPRFTRGGKVVVGTVEEIVYRAPHGSQRSGAPWSHEAGDRGLGPLFRNRKRATLLADPNSGALQLQTRGSGVHFNEKAGIIG